MHRRINPHRHFVWIFTGNLFIHFKQVTIFFFHYFFTQAVNRFVICIFQSCFTGFNFPVPDDSVFKIEVNGHFGCTYSIPFIASFFSRPGCHITRNQVTECRVSPFQVIIPFLFRYINGFPGFPFLFGNPYPSIVTQAFTHQR